ncbi:MAG: T9SS type A sorting domain-containing protein [Flavobacteriaceae bacterium]|nr:T9SS type A sorting domain-containing protein [Flavobacteriaceae bacterium]
MKTTTFLLLLASFLTLSVTGQTVSTFSDGSPDDGIDIDSNGNLYVSDIYGGKIFKYTPSGVMSEFASGLNYPNGLAIDSQGRIYSCQIGGTTIQRFLQDGTLDQTFDVGVYPSGIIKAFDNDDMIFTGYYNGSMHRLSITDGTVTTISNASELFGPVGLAYDGNGELYVGNYGSYSDPDAAGNRAIYRVLTDGSLEYVATVGSTGNLGFIAYAQGMLWGTVLHEDKIYRINPNGINDVTLFAGSDRGTDDGDISTATFTAPNGIAFNDTGDVMYISESSGSNNLRVISGISLSIEEFQGNDIKLITPPNQSKIILKAKIRNANNFELTIRQLFGQTVLRETVDATGNGSIVKNISTEAWDNGIYFMTIQAGENITTKRFIVNN